MSLYFRAVDEGFRYAQVGRDYRQGGRAVVECSATHADFPGRKAHLYFLLIEAGGWRLTAGVAEQVVAAAFLRGEIDAPFDWTALPSNDAADVWGRAYAAQVFRGSLLTVQELEALTGRRALALLPSWSEEGVAAWDALPDTHAAVLGIGDLVAALEEQGGPRALAVLSTTPGEGAAMLAGLLGRMWAALGQRVLLVDGDLERPELHAVFGHFAKTPGLLQVLAGTASIEEAIRPGSPAWLPAGGEGAPSPEALGRVRSLFRELRSGWDRVVVVCSAPALDFWRDRAGLAPLLAVQLGAVPSEDVSLLWSKHAPHWLGAVAVRLIPESIPALEGMDALRPFADGPQHQATYLGSFDLPALGRTMAGIELLDEGGIARQKWVLFAHGTGGILAPIAEAAAPSEALLLRDVDDSLPGKISDDRVFLGEYHLSREVNGVQGLTSALVGLLGEALTASGAPGDVKALRRALREFSRSAEGGAVAALAASPEALPEVLRRALQGALPEGASLEAAFADEAWVAEHGEAVGRALIEALSSALAGEPDFPAEGIAIDLLAWLSPWTGKR